MRSLQLPGFPPKCFCALSLHHFWSSASLGPFTHASTTTTIQRRPGPASRRASVFQMGCGHFILRFSSVGSVSCNRGLAAALIAKLHGFFCGSLCSSAWARFQAHGPLPSQHAFGRARTIQQNASKRSTELGRTLARYGLKSSLAVGALNIAVAIIRKRNS